METQPPESEEPSVSPSRPQEETPEGARVPDEPGSRSSPSSSSPPRYADYPTYPAYPLPGAPSWSSAPTLPGSPVYPGSSGYYGAPPGMPGGAAAPRPLDQRLAAPFAALMWALPGQAAARLLAVALGVVVAVAALAAVWPRSDWSIGALAGSGVALALSVIYLAVLVVRLRLRRRAASASVLGPGAALLLVCVSGLGIAASGPLHLAQAHTLEASHNWSAAIREYQLGGQRTSASDDLARVYVEWGESLLQGGRYPEAIDRFMTVIGAYADATAQVRRAGKDLLQAYAGWLGTGSTSLPYPTVLSGLTHYEESAICGAKCRAAVASLEARARFQYGMQLLGQQNYVEAAFQFSQIETRFPNNPFARRAHVEAAIAWYDLAESEVKGASCADTIPTFQLLATQYADTPEGVKAKAALNGGVTVSGLIEHYPYSTGILYLSLSISPDSDRAQYFSDDYSSTLTPSHAYTFQHVRPGAYNLSLVLSDGSFTFWRYTSPSYNPYTVVVGPLCPVQVETYYYGP